jgi:hypothetical protein
LPRPAELATATIVVNAVIGCSSTGLYDLCGEVRVHQVRDMAAEVNVLRELQR